MAYNGQRTPSGLVAENRSLSRLKSFNMAEEKTEGRRQASLEILKETSLSNPENRPQSVPMSRTSSVHGLVPIPKTAHENGSPLTNGEPAMVTKPTEPSPPKSQTPFPAMNIVINSAGSSGKKDPKAPLKGAYFNDGKRQVDFMLVYEQGLHKTETNGGRLGKFVDKDQQRAFFERNLIEAGLNLEEDAHLYESGVLRSRNPSPAPSVRLDAPPAPSPRAAMRSTTFVKIHAPFEVLCAQAEKLNLKMPLKMTDPILDGMDNEYDGEEGESVFVQGLRYVKKLHHVLGKKTGIMVTGTSTATAGSSVSKANAQHAKKRIPWTFNRKRVDLFDLGADPPNTFFTPTQRLEIVWNMLQQARNDPEDEKRRGIERLLDTGVYEKAFALHDGECDRHGKGIVPGEYKCQREKLRHIWANWKSSFRRQPLDLIRNYYGEKAGFYFAFLGFYTKMLIFPAFFGLASFLYGIWNKVDDVIVKDICDGNNAPGNFMMCPLCQPPGCHFTLLSAGCENAKWDYRMDNEATLVVACLTVVWSVCMLKMWKRREAELAYEWDTYDVEQEDVVIRPEYEERAPSKRRNPITREMEPYVPPMTKASWMLASCCITLFILCLVGVALALLVIGRIAMYGALQPIVTENVECARWAVHGLIFIVVSIFEKLYHDLAHKLTSLECPRTQESWLSSFLWKVFIFELLNDFVPIAYAAWVKGKLIRTPLDLNWHSELCDTGGCMGEVTELTAVLLLMRMVIGNAAEIGWPFAKNVYKQFVERRQEVVHHDLPLAHNSQLGVENENDNKNSRWHSDYLLCEPELDGVAEEYMEMMIQFAFCTLFVPAFPLAPLVCFLNNIIEIRVDAINFTTTTRRLIPIRVPGIQIWYNFLTIISKLAIICNAGLIAFTSTIVPRLYYKYAFSPTGSYENYTQFSVSKLNQSAWDKEEVKNAFDHHNISECFYEDYRQPVAPYDRIQHWWEVTCVRLAVFAIFALLGFTFEWLFNFSVDDQPRHVNQSIQRRRYFVTKALETYEDDKEKKAAINHIVDQVSKEQLLEKDI